MARFENRVFKRQAGFFRGIDAQFRLRYHISSKIA